MSSSTLYDTPSYDTSANLLAYLKTKGILQDGVPVHLLGIGEHVSMKVKHMWTLLRVDLGFNLSVFYDGVDVF